MLRILLCAAAVFSLVLSICLFPQTASARRCPEKEPETLLSLYQNSDAIYIAAFDKIVEGEVVESTDDYSVKEIKKHFTISSTLKGQSRKFFVLDDREYLYKTAAPEPQVATVDESETTEQPEVIEEPAYEEEEDGDSFALKSGDTLLLFVKDGDEEEDGEEKGEGERPTLADYRDGIKKLSMEKIGVYEARIKELNSIFSAKKVSESRLLEWVIRCAEDPATRWEGTFELLQSVQIQEWNEQAAERRKERLAAGLPVEEEPVETEEPEGEQEEPVQKNFDTAVFARMLDINHKQTLANILLNNHGSSENGKDQLEPIAGDRELIELVKRWGDPRLMGFLLDKLRTGSDDAEANAGTMSIVAEILSDDDASAIAQKYEENAYEDADETVEVEAEEVDSAPPDEAKQEKTVEVEPEADQPGEPGETEEVEIEGPEPEVKKQTYKDLRAELMQKFLAQCEKVIAQKEKENETKLAR